MQITAFIAFIAKLEADGGWGLYLGQVRRRRGPRRCPIEHVAGMQGAYRWAGPSIGLSPFVVSQLVFAIDLKPGYSSELRARVMAACGLKGVLAGRKAEGR